MTYTRDFSSFEFSPLLLPSDIDEDTDASTLRALTIYAQVDPEKFVTTTLVGLNNIVDEFAGQQAFKTTELGSPLTLGVANFQTPPADTDFLFVEGIAAHKHARGMDLGVFIVQNIVEMALSYGKVALEGNVRPGMEPYYEKRGWDYVKDSENRFRMRLEIE